MEEHFRIRYEGFRADEHLVDMREMGRSLVGIERVISAGFIVASARRLPKQRERLPIAVYVSEPRPGSVEIVGFLGPLAGVLPIFHDLFITGAAEFIWRSLSWVLLMLGGRPSDAEIHLERIIDMAREMHRAQLEDRERERIAYYEDRHREREMWFRVVETLKPSAKDAVAPVGPSCDKMTVGTRMLEHATTVDLPMADAVRARGELQVSEMAPMRIRVDGFTLHNNQLKIEDPSTPNRYVNASIRDPAFAQIPNIYTETASHGGWLDVQAKSTYKEGQLKTVYVFDAKPVEGA